MSMVYDGSIALKFDGSEFAESQGLIKKQSLKRTGFRVSTVIGNYMKSIYFILEARSVV